MMTVAIIVSVLFAAAAVASWVYGAVAYAQTLRSVPREEPELKWLMVVGWLFARKRLQGAAAEHAARVNKALVTFIACVMVAMSAAALASNLSRFSR